MKVKANQIELGMTVRWGVVTITVDKIEESFQKNGKQLITLHGAISRSHGRGYKPTKFYGKITPKGETLLPLVK